MSHGVRNSTRKGFSVECIQFSFLYFITLLEVLENVEHNIVLLKNLKKKEHYKTILSLFRTQTTWFISYLSTSTTVYFASVQ